MRRKLAWMAAAAVILFPGCKQFEEPQDQRLAEKRPYQDWDEQDKRKAMGPQKDPDRTDVQEEAAREEAEKTFVVAHRTYYVEKNVEGARDQLRAALRLDPRHAKARALLDEVERRLAVRPAAGADEGAREASIARQKARVAIEAHLRAGARLAAEQRPDAAVKEYEGALLATERLEHGIDRAAWAHRIGVLLQNAKRMAAEAGYRKVVTSG